MTEDTNLNPVVKEIPEGAVVTVILRNGTRHSGTDDTTNEQEAAGVLALFNVIGTGARAENRKTYLLASEIIGFEIDYE